MKHPHDRATGNVRPYVVAMLAMTLAAAACTPQDGESPLTTARCIELGGSIVGDIGDGRIHRPDYVCESGVRPVGPIEFLEGEPIPVEGAVCCPQVQ